MPYSITSAYYNYASHNRGEHWMKFWIYMGVKMIVNVVQIQRQINVNVVKPGFTTSLRSKYHISPTQSKFKSNAAKPE